jgi:hypothetical protein
VTLDEATGLLAAHHAVVRYQADGRVRVATQVVDGQVVVAYGDAARSPSAGLLEAVEELRQELAAREHRRHLHVV